MITRLRVERASIRQVLQQRRRRVIEDRQQAILQMIEVVAVSVPSVSPTAEIAVVANSSRRDSANSDSDKFIECFFIDI